MTKAEFEKKLKHFLEWTSDVDRPASSWMLSLEEWAGREYSKTYKLENPKPTISEILI